MPEPLMAPCPVCDQTHAHEGEFAAAHPDWAPPHMGGGLHGRVFDDVGPGLAPVAVNGHDGGRGVRGGLRHRQRGSEVKFWRVIYWLLAAFLVVVLIVAVRGHQLLREDERRCESNGGVYVDTTCLRGAEEVK